MDHEDIRVYSILKVDAGEVEANSPATVEVTVDVEPEFDLPAYEEFEYTIRSTEVSKEEVEKELDGLRDQRASFEEVDREVADGDYVKCSYEGTLDGEPVSEILPDKPMYGKQSNTWEEAGQAKGMGVEGIATGIVGMKKDEKKEIEITFEEDFELAPLAGKKVIYAVEIHEVREKKAPEADNEDFLKALKAENLDQLKEKIEADLKVRKERQNIDAKRRQATQKILEIAGFPPSPTSCGGRIPDNLPKNRPKGRSTRSQAGGNGIKARRALERIPSSRSSPRQDFACSRPDCRKGEDGRHQRGFGSGCDTGSHDDEGRPSDLRERTLSGSGPASTGSAKTSYTIKPSSSLPPGARKRLTTQRVRPRTDFTIHTKKLLQKMGAYLPLPYVYEREGRQERAWDIYSRLLRDRIVFIGTPIDDYVANSIIAQLLFLQMEDPKKEIHVYINSPGGSVSDGMAIYDTLNFLQCDIVTYCIGMAASMSTVLLAAGTTGKRFALPNSRVMIHQPSGGAGGQTSDISIAAKEILRWRQTINEILAKHSGKTIEQLEKDSDRDYYMSAEEAKEYGLVDEVMSKKPKD